jgi:NAD(P)-dependent dehydrogenase (short-subunit alcohol dehydrogenase family)
VNVRYSAVDMSRPDEIRAMAAYARTEFGKVDIIVNYAGQLACQRSRKGGLQSHASSRPTCIDRTFTRKSLRPSCRVRSQWLPPGAGARPAA